MELDQVVDLLPRLIYLASELQGRTPRIPPSLGRYLAEVEIVQSIAQNGLEGAAILLDMPEHQLKQLHQLGRVKDPSQGLFRVAVAQRVHDAIQDGEIPIRDRLHLYSTLDTFLSDTGDQLFQMERVSMSKLDPEAEIPKWNSGFTPIDLVCAKLYQSLIVMMGRPGIGKTSLMLTFAECIKRNLGWRIAFFEQEIPGQLMQARMSPIIQRGNPFDDDDVLITGGATIDDIVEIASEKPGDQVIFIDYPDLMASSGESRRTDIEDIYKVTVRLKSISRMVVVASQPRRRDNVLSQASVADAWQKAWYADIIIGIQGIGRGKFLLRGLKNRFGPPENEVRFNYNLADLTFDEPIMDEEDPDW